MGDKKRKKGKKRKSDFTTKLFAKLRVVLPHVTIVVVVFIYAVVGAFAFYLIESGYEVDCRRNETRRIEADRNRTVHELLELVETIDDEEEFMEKGRMVLDAMAKRLELRIYGNESNAYTINAYTNNENIWTLQSAVFFTLTTLTTVGYGQPAPITMHGRLFCILYGLIGIPLMVVTLADMAKFVGSFLCSQYEMIKRKISRLMKGQPPPKRRKLHDDDEPLDPDDEPTIPIPYVMALLLAYPIVNGFIEQEMETEWTYEQAFYFCFITIFTIGFGDFVPSKHEFYLPVSLIIIVGLIITTMSVDLVAVEFINKIHYFGRAIGSAKDQMRQAFSAISGLGAHMFGMGHAWHLTQAQMDSEALRNAFHPELPISFADHRQSPTRDHPHVRRRWDDMSVGDSDDDFYLLL